MFGSQNTCRNTLQNDQNQERLLILRCFFYPIHFSDWFVKCRSTEFLPWCLDNIQIEFSNLKLPPTACWNHYVWEHYSLIPTNELTVSLVELKAAAFDNISVSETEANLSKSRLWYNLSKFHQFQTLKRFAWWNSSSYVIVNKK